MTQTEQILSHLKAGNTITPLEALGKFDCLRLGARIADLRDRGWLIDTEMVKQHGKRFARYSLISKRRKGGKA